MKRVDLLPLVLMVAWFERFLGAGSDFLFVNWFTELRERMGSN